MELENKIESILFYRSEPMSTRLIADILGISESAVRDSIDRLGKSLQGRGVRLVSKDDSFLLTTAPEASEIIEGLHKEELQRSLGKAGLETLTIILYNGPLRRSEIDYIRGVNSTYTLRHLLIRGLIKKNVMPNDRRSYLYQASFELLSFMGIERVQDLPEYRQLKEEMKIFSLTQEDDTANE